MRHVWKGWPLLLAAVLGCGGPETTAERKGSGSLDVIEIDGLHSKAPEDWVREQPTQQQSMRFAQFRLPGAGGADASLVVFRGIGGTPKDNINRWKGQFSKIDGDPKIDSFPVGHLEAVVLDIQGTFLQSDMMNPQAEQLLLTDYRMVAVTLDGGTQPFQIKLTGPSKTIERHKAAFIEWLKGFK